MRNRLLAAAVAALALAAAAPTAVAQLPGTTPTTPAPAPAPAADAKLAVVVASGLADRGRHWVLRGDRALVRGNLRPYVDGQTVDVRLYSGKKLIGHRTVKVRKGKGNTGIYSVALGVHRAGTYSVEAAHAATPQQKAGRSRRVRFGAVDPRPRGSEAIRLLQIGLRRLAYVAPLTGRMEAGTERAVLAFRKVNRMSHNSAASKAVFRKVFHGAGTFHLRYPKAGSHAEADLSRQVLVLASKGRAIMIFTVSSGKPSTPTIQGHFRFYRKDPGTNSEGMVDSNYFQGGYAVHGYPSVPATYPASHGCIRVPIPDARRIYNAIRLGESIFVYH